MSAGAEPLGRWPPSWRLNKGLLLPSACCGCAACACTASLSAAPRRSAPTPPCCAASAPTPCPAARTRWAALAAGAAGSGAAVPMLPGSAGVSSHGVRSSAAAPAMAALPVLLNPPYLLAELWVKVVIPDMASTQLCVLGAWVLMGALSQRTELGQLHFALLPTVSFFTPSSLPCHPPAGADPRV